MNCIDDNILDRHEIHGTLDVINDHCCWVCFNETNEGNEDKNLDLTRDKIRTIVMVKSCR